MRLNMEVMKMTFQDLSLTAKVKAALFHAEDVKAMEIDVDVNDGIVTLKGNVSKAAHDQAVEVTRNIEGIRAIEDELSVTFRE
jgi:osmotically-inducible protein OsmY